MRAIGLVFLSVCLTACGSSGVHNPVSEATATKSALASVVSLEQYRAKQLSMAPVTGFTVLSTQLTTKTASVADSQGNMLMVSPAPHEAWVVQITAPPQGIWGSITAVAEVDSTSGVVAGIELRVLPADRPVKGGYGTPPTN